MSEHSDAYQLWRQAGGGTPQYSRERYRELMIEHGLLIPGPPEPLPCGWPRRPASDGADSAAAVILGTAADCDIRVNDPYASPHHARITSSGGRPRIEDLGSTNGTYLQRYGNARVRVYAPTLVLPGDTIWIGRTGLKWEPPPEWAGIDG